MAKPRIIVWDLETLTDLKRVMGVFPGLSAYPGLTLKASINSIICFGYKVLGEKKAHCISAWDYPKRWKKDVNDDYDIVRASYEVLKDADGIVTHNGKRFDFKFLNSRLVKYGLKPLHKVPHIDTCSVAKSNLFLFNNRLNTVAKHLGCETKMENGGWELWERVLRREVKAQKTMAAYCKQDVRVTEEVFLKLRPFANSIPNYNLFVNGKQEKVNDGRGVCPSCGSEHINKFGLKRTKTRAYQRYQCQDCGAVSQTDAKDRNLK